MNRIATAFVLTLTVLLAGCATPNVKYSDLQPPTTATVSGDAVTVTIGTSADAGEDPLRGRFTGAGSCSAIAPSTGTSNKSRIGQPIDTPSQSQPGRLETNQPSVAPRFDR